MSAQPPEADTSGAVSTVVGLGIDGIGLNGQSLQNVSYGCQAPHLDFIPRHDNHGRRGEEILALDPRTGDGNGVKFVDDQLFFGSFFRFGAFLDIVGYIGGRLQCERTAH